MTRTHELEQQVKEKKALVEKLRHEGLFLHIRCHFCNIIAYVAVIINEHLMEALRRLRRNSTENNVDRRLVTNVILSFLQIPRGDTKRFEILSLLASILSWTDQEREKAGLQRSGLSESTASSAFWGRSPTASSPAKADLEKTDETEVCHYLLFFSYIHCYDFSHFLVFGWNFFLQRQRQVDHQTGRHLHLHEIA